MGKSYRRDSDDEPKEDPRGRKCPCGEPAHPDLPTCVGCYSSPPPPAPRSSERSR